MEAHIIINDPDLQEAAVTAGLQYIEFQEGTDQLLPVGKYICIAPSDAKALAARLIEAGVEDIAVSYLDDDCVDDGIAWDAVRNGAAAIAGMSRDYYYDQIHTIADHQYDPDDDVYIDVGLDFFDTNIRWRKSGEVVVCAGPYGCGKSTLMQMLGIKWQEGGGALYDDGTRRERPVWFATWEDHVRSQEKQIWKHYTHGDAEPSPSKQDKARAALRSIAITVPRADYDRDFGWYEKAARFQNKRYGTNFFVLDPWSEFEHVFDFRKENETQYVKKVMRMLRRLSEELKSIFVVVTHLPKSKYSEDGSIKSFRVADAMGSVQFGSSADRGICVLRSGRLVGGSDHMIVHFDKIKVEGLDEMGIKATKALTLNRHDHRLVHDLDASTEAAYWWEHGKPPPAPADKADADGDRPSHVIELRGRHD